MRLVAAAGTASSKAASVCFQTRAGPGGSRPRSSRGTPRARSRASCSRRRCARMRDRSDRSARRQPSRALRRASRQGSTERRRIRDPACAEGCRPQSARGERHAGRRHEHCLCQMNLVHEGSQISGEVLDSVTGSGLVRGAVSALRESEGVDRGRKVLQDLFEGAPRVDIRMEKHDRHTRLGACSTNGTLIPPGSVARWRARAAGSATAIGEPSAPTSATACRRERARGDLRRAPRGRAPRPS
jgi:hypothetical protein